MTESEIVRIPLRSKILNGVHNDRLFSCFKLPEFFTLLPKAASLLLLISEDGGPLTDNVAFISEQRFFDREAELASPKARLVRRGLTGHRR